MVQLMSPLFSSGLSVPWIPILPPTPTGRPSCVGTSPLVAHLFVAIAVDLVWIVQREEPIPAAARMLLDDCVNALGRAAVALPQFGAGLEAASEDRVVGLKQPAFVIDDQLVMLFENRHRPIERIVESDRAGLVEQQLARGRHAIGSHAFDFHLRERSWRRGRRRVGVGVSRTSGGGGAGIPELTYFWPGG